MKRFGRIAFFLLFIAISFGILAACGGSNGNSEKITLTYVAGNGGSINGNASQEIEKLSTGTQIEAVPDSGYRFVKWSDDEISALRKDAFVIKSLTVTAEFELIPYVTLTYTAGTGGNISGKTLQTMKKGQTGEAVTAVPVDGYVFTNWSDNKLSAKRQDTFVHTNIAVTAQFSIAVSLTYNAGEGGYIAGNAGQIIGKGRNGKTVTAVSESGYRFVKWSDNVTTAERTDLAVDADLTVTAEFTPTVTLTYEAGTGGFISGNANQTIDVGQNGITVTAVPDIGYMFVEWSDGVLTAERTDTGIEEDFSVTALFDVENFAGGTGTDADPYQISTAGQILNIERLLTAHYKLINDIDLSAIANFKPIGTSGNSFNGVLNGGNFTISNLTINTAEYYAGMFAAIGEHGKVFNLEIANANVTAPNCAGILAGINFGTIEKVAVWGILNYVHLNDSSICFGGLSGIANKIIAECGANVEIIINGAKDVVYAGGLTGKTFAGIINSYSSGDITVSGGREVYIGGLAGYCGGSISNAFAGGKIAVTGKATVYSGGIAGKVMVVLSNCHWIYGGNGAEFAVGFNDMTEIPMDFGAAKHQDIADIQGDLIVDLLNDGAGSLVWIAVENELPLLAWQIQ